MKSKPKFKVGDEVRLHANDNSARKIREIDGDNCVVFWLSGPTEKYTEISFPAACLIPASDKAKPRIVGRKKN